MEAPLKCRWQWLEPHPQVVIPEDEVVAEEEVTEAEEEALVVAEVEAEVVDGMENNLISKGALEIGGMFQIYLDNVFDLFLIRLLSS